MSSHSYGYIGYNYITMYMVVSNWYLNWLNERHPISRLLIFLNPWLINLVSAWSVFSVMAVEVTERFPPYTQVSLAATAPENQPCRLKMKQKIVGCSIQGVVSDSLLGTSPFSRLAHYLNLFPHDPGEIWRGGKICCGVKPFPITNAKHRFTKSNLTEKLHNIMTELRWKARRVVQCIPSCCLSKTILETSATVMLKKMFFVSHCSLCSLVLLLPN